MVTNSANKVDSAWLQAEVRSTARAFADQLRQVDDPATQVPNLDWTVAELAAHLVSLPALYRAQHELGDGFSSPDDWAKFSIGARAHVTETDLTKLADLVEAEIGSLIDELGPLGDTPRMLYGQETTAANTLGGILSELIIHGMDLGALTGTTVTMSRRQANAAIPAMMTLVPVFVDPVQAQKCPGTYVLKFRGGGEFTQRVGADGRVTVEPGATSAADARVNADPVAFLLVGLGRMNQFVASFTGKIIGYGRKPWLLYRLGNSVVDGV